MGEATPRAALLGMLKRERGLDVAAIEALCSGARFAPAPLSEAEKAALSAEALTGAPAPVPGDYPDWLDPHFAKVFGDDRAAEGAALARRAPLDLRVNTLKVEREEVLPKLAHLHAALTQWSPIGLRIRLGADARNPAIHAEPPFRKGEVEIQDEGSQLAALLAGAKPGQQVVDLARRCRRQDVGARRRHGQPRPDLRDRHRQTPIAADPRAYRARWRPQYPGAYATRAAGATSLDDLIGRADLVLIDAPCTGTGTWRRNPDAKWRVRPGALDERLKEQASLLDRAARWPSRRAHRLHHLLRARRGKRRAGAGLRRPDADFSVEKPAEVAQTLGERAYLFAQSALISDEGLLMTPRRTDTDGFFVSLMRRNS